MSVVDDVLHLFCIVLDYFGVSPDMLVPVWNSKLCGQYRSIVRMIGTNLQLAPVPRVHFQVPFFNYQHHVEQDTPAIPSFADVLWVYEDEGETFAKTRNHLPPKKQTAPSLDAARYQGPGPSQAYRGRRAQAQSADPGALHKITVLESELLKLRAQIAMIVTAAPSAGPMEPQDSPGRPAMSPAPAPAHTSTPRCAPPPPPPPPAPPLPPASSSNAETLSAIEQIRLRRKGKDDADKEPPRNQDSSGVKAMPSMLDVLKNLNQVKLRSVDRSPGGTPVRRRRSKGVPASLGDPAALIAEALKRKFAHRLHNVSSDKENSLELSPFGSPETPKVPPNNRRSRGRLQL